MNLRVLRDAPFSQNHIFVVFDSSVYAYRSHRFLGTLFGYAENAAPLAAPDNEVTKRSCKACKMQE